MIDTTSGKVVADGGGLFTFKTDLRDPTEGRHVGGLLVFTDDHHPTSTHIISGSLGDGEITVAMEMKTAPKAGDSFVIYPGEALGPWDKHKRDDDYG